MLICHLYVFFSEWTVQVFSPFLIIGLSAFLFLRLKSSLYTLSCVYVCIFNPHDPYYWDYLTNLTLQADL